MAPVLIPVVPLDAALEVPLAEPGTAVVAAEMTGDAAEVAADAAEVAAAVTGEAAAVTGEIPEGTGDVAAAVGEAPGPGGETADDGVGTAGGGGKVAARAWRENSRKTARIPAATIAACIARTAMRRTIGCGMSSSYSPETGRGLSAPGRRLETRARNPLSTTITRYRT